MRLQALRPHFVDGRIVARGEVYEIADAWGGYLLTTGRAQPAPEPAAAPKPKRHTLTAKPAAALVQGSENQDAQ